MKCFRPECRRRGDVAVDFGEGLHVVFCYQDGVLAVAERQERRIRALRLDRVELTIRPRGA